MARCRHRRALSAGALFVSALCLLFALPSWALERARVARALDGDSLLLADGRQVRLIGINTPEFGKDGEPDQPLAAEAKRLAARLTEGREVRLEYGAEHRDRYGRLLAYVALPEGPELQQTLLAEGLAWYVAIPPNLDRLDAYRALEQRARVANKGVWAIQSFAPIPAEALSRRERGFRRIQGRVQRIRYGRQTAVLELTSNVFLVLPREHWHYFPGGPEALLGRPLVARGWLTEYKNSLRMRVSHPAMLERAP